jgi:hypothetical protein
VNVSHGRKGTAVARYDANRNHWRWYCSLCNEERGTTSSDPDYDGPVQTAIRIHIDRVHVHAGDEVTIEIKNADGDIDEDDDE